MDAFMEGDPPQSMSLAQRRQSWLGLEEGEDDAHSTASSPLKLASPISRRARRLDSIPHSHPRPLPTPNRPSGSPLQSALLPSAPASPPTPAPSPTPQHRAPSWNNAGENEDAYLRDARTRFSRLDGSERQRFLAEILNLCDMQQLSFVQHFVSPRLKKDPFRSLPTELCLKVLSYIDDPRTLARASQVSKLWYNLLIDDAVWKKLCEQHSYRRLSNYAPERYNVLESIPFTVFNSREPTALPSIRPAQASKFLTKGIIAGPSASEPDLRTRNIESVTRPKSTYEKQTQAMTYKSHFKQRYMVETAWKRGGAFVCKHIHPDQGVVTSLHLTPKYIVVALDNARIHVFTADGEFHKTLTGHVMGVWAMVPWGDTLVSGGCDRDVRVWNMATGEIVHILRGHTSTVRCLKMSNSDTAISGSRDTTLRIWDIRSGICKNVLVGHQSSVRCLEIHGDIVVSGSYDTTAKVWSISEGRCLRTLTGHFSQIYAIAFDGVRIATGSLDTSVRIWDPNTGDCQAILQGHTSLVGQLQMRGDTLVTGGSDGSVRVWSLTLNGAIHRLAAHDNSVTSLQFDDTRIVSGGSDGRVKVWDLESGTLVRELGSPAEAVWRVAFEEEKAVIMASRANRTIMEVWRFSPPDEALASHYRAESPSSNPDEIMAQVRASESPERIDIQMEDAPPNMEADAEYFGKKEDQGRKGGPHKPPPAEGPADGATQNH